MLKDIAGQSAGALGQCSMAMALSRVWNEKSGQDIGEYAVMLAVILVLVLGIVRLIGSNANTVFSNVARSGP